MRTLMLTIALVACSTDDRPTPTRAVCPNPNNPQFTWANFGSDFMCHYCTNCHDSSLKLDQRNGAPLFHDLDTLLGTVGVAQHTDEQAAWGPKAHNSFMPGEAARGRCPSMLGGPLDHECPEPTDQERVNLGVFLACELQRPQDYNGSNANMPSDHCASYTGPH
jgi:hypothetical protein